MQGFGNDFFVFDAPASRRQDLAAERLRALADRHTGVGFDQALVLERPARPRQPGVATGSSMPTASEVEQCGNGARCIAALLYAQGPEPAASS